MDWRTAFAQNFGEDVNAFVDEFESQSGARIP